MNLNDLLLKANLIQTPLFGVFQSMDIQNIQVDSRLVGPFDLFVSIPCPMAPQYVQEALDKGCRVLVVDREILELSFVQESQALVIMNEQPRFALSKLAAAFYNQMPPHMVAVTGTNGKTSTVHFVRQILEYLLKNVASLGTLGLTLSKGQQDLMPAVFDKLLSGASLTTLDALRFHKTLEALQKNHVDYLAFEASSHGLDQYRLHGAQLKAAALTNITQDHLDYHKTFKAYMAAKGRLFKEILPENAFAILPLQDASFSYMKKICDARQQHILSISQHPSDQGKATLWASSLRAVGQCQVFNLSYQGKNYNDLTLNISGAFQIDNVLTAVGLCISLGFSIDDCLSALPSLSPAVGRLECISHQGGIAVYVDYAHTPDALQKALQSLRPFTKGDLWVVFGCGGNRDPFKRPLMGKIAIDYADHVIITDDNPRFEDANDIRKSIRSGIASFDIKESVKTFSVKEIPSRREAIHYALQHAKEGDVVLVAGKGHETGQLVSGLCFDFDDRQEILHFFERF